jgi:hypothetical protein
VIFYLESSVTGPVVTWVTRRVEIAAASQATSQRKNTDGWFRVDTVPRNDGVVAGQPVTDADDHYDYNWGPTMEMDVKPQFMAPGSSIVSTYPTNKASYTIISGSSTVSL